MPKELSGFQKSTPANYPSTTEQSPNSAWDIDLSPFHRIVDQQAILTKEIIAKLDETRKKLEELSNTIQEKDQNPLLLSILDEYKENKKLIQKHVESQQEISQTIQQLEQHILTFQESAQKSISTQQDILQSGITLNPSQVNTIKAQQERLFSNVMDSCQKLVASGLAIENSMSEFKILFKVFLEERRSNCLIIENNMRDLRMMFEQSLKEKKISEQQGNLVFWVFVAVASIFAIYLFITRFST